MTTFATVLSALLRADAGRPLVTFYDDGPAGADEGARERTELSVTTYANWVAKAGSLLVDELDLEKGQTIRLDLPTHWLGTVFLGAAWTAGLVVTDAADPDAVVCGPATLDAWAERADDVVVLASALHPMGLRYADGVPPGVHDVGVEIWSQPDAFTAWDPPTADDPAHDLGGTEVTQADLWSVGGSDARVLSTANSVTPEGLPAFAGAVVGGGSLVLVARASAERIDAIATAERASLVSRLDT